MIKIERQIWKHVRHDDEGRRSWHAEGITVRSGRCRLAGCNAAARSGMVEYDHLLPPQPAKVLGHDARDHVWAARCRTLCDQLHRPCRIVLRLRRESDHGTNDQKRPNAQPRLARLHRSLRSARASSASVKAVALRRRWLRHPVVAFADTVDFSRRALWSRARLRRAARAWA